MSKWVPSSSTKGFALAARFMIEEKCGGAEDRNTYRQLLFGQGWDRYEYGGVGAGRDLKALVIELYSINDCFRMSDHIQLLEDRHVNVV